jgi:DNA-binding CsgD family transcriptional regulator
MRKYNIANYVRYKTEVEAALKRVRKPIDGDYTYLNNEEIKGAIRRAVDINRGDIRIPEHKLNEIRRNPKDEKMVAMFFNSVFSSIDANPNQDENMAYQVVDKSEPYNIALLNAYLLQLMKKHLTIQQYEVLRLSFGLDCDKHSANQIANLLDINVSTAHVRISQIKRDAIQCLIDNVDSSQVLDYL